MTPALDAPALAGIEAVLRETAGITFTGGTRSSLPMSVAAAARELDLAAEEFVDRVQLRDEAALTALVDHAVIPETYFFRHHEHFRALTRTLLPSLAQRPSLRIWSAGCATGEEPYSLAIALLAAGRKAGDDTVLGTDVSPRLLARARLARYGRWSLRRVPEGIPTRFLRDSGGLVEVGEEVRRVVSFRRHNLIAERPPLSSCDLVVCRNVLIYFETALARRVVGELVGAVRPGGWLILGPAEAPLAAGFEVEPVEMDGATLFRRTVPGENHRPVRAWPAPLRERPRPRSRSRETQETRGGWDVSPSTSSAQAEPARPPAGGAAPDVSAPDVSAPPAGESPRAIATASPYHRALVAAEGGRLDEAQALAREAAADLAAPAHLLLALLAETAGDDDAAFASARRALYLDPADPLAHATLARLHARAGRDDEARRSRANALAALRDRDDGELLPGPAPITVGALRRALRR
jgi:chemotaxis protein methyltransferase CheR